MTEERRLCYRAPCPGCRAEVRWYASAHVDPDAPLDLAVTHVSYEIDCAACGPAPAAARRPVPQVRPGVSASGWLGRTA